MNLMARMKTVSKKLNQKYWGIPFIAEPPTGEILTLDNETEQPLKSIQYHGITTRLDAETGEDILVQEPTITVASNSFAIPPKSGEKWFFKIPTTPVDLIDENTELKRYRMSPDNFKHYPMMNLITIALIEVKQKPNP